MSMPSPTSALDARVRGVNNAHAAALEWFPRLAELFRPFVGATIEKVNGDLLKKVADKVAALGLPNRGGLSIFRQDSRYSLCFQVKTCVDFNGHAHYYDFTLYVGEMQNGLLKGINAPPPKLRTDYSAEEVTRLRTEYEAAKAKADAARNKLYPFGEYDR